MSNKDLLDPITPGEILREDFMGSDEYQYKQAFAGSGRAS